MRAERHPLIIAIVISGAFLGYLEMTVVITALPSLGRVFPAMAAWLPWLTTVSLLAAGVALPLAGKLADDWGPRKTFLLGIALFTLSSLLSALVGIWLPNRLELLIAFRVLQGFGGGVFAPVGLKIVSVFYRGTARTTTVGLAAAIGPLAAVLGPNVGGFLVDRFPWQSIFLLNVPLAAAIGLAALLLMKEIPSCNGNSVDVIGAVLLPAATLCLMLGLTWARDDGLPSSRALAAILAAFLLAALLVRLEKRHPRPLLDFGVTGDKEMAAILVLSFFQGLAMYSSLFFLSFYAQTHPAIQATGTAAGMMLSPAALGQIAVAPLVGFLVSKTGYRGMVMGGISLTALSLLVLVIEPTNRMILAGLLLASRVGGTMASVPLAAAGLEARRAQAGTITGLRQLSNVLGGVVGPVALSLLLPQMPAGETAQYGFSRVFLVMSLLLMLTLPVSLFIPAKDLEQRAPGS